MITWQKRLAHGVRVNIVDINCSRLLPPNLDCIGSHSGSNCLTRRVARIAKPCFHNIPDWQLPKPSGSSQPFSFLETIVIPSIPLRPTDHDVADCELCELRGWATPRHSRLRFGATSADARRTGST